MATATNSPPIPAQNPLQQFFWELEFQRNLEDLYLDPLTKDEVAYPMEAFVAAYPEELKEELDNAANEIFQEQNPAPERNKPFLKLDLPKQVELLRSYTPLELKVQMLPAAIRIQSLTMADLLGDYLAKNNLNLDGFVRLAPLKMQETLNTLYAQFHEAVLIENKKEARATRNPELLHKSPDDLIELSTQQPQQIEAIFHQAAAQIVGASALKSIIDLNQALTFDHQKQANIKGRFLVPRAIAQQVGQEALGLSPAQPQYQVSAVEFPKTMQVSGELEVFPDKRPAMSAPISETPIPQTSTTEVERQEKIEQEQQRLDAKKQEESVQKMQDEYKKQQAQAAKIQDLQAQTSAQKWQKRSGLTAKALRLGATSASGGGLAGLDILKKTGIPLVGAASGVMGTAFYYYYSVNFLNS